MQKRRAQVTTYYVNPEPCDVILDIGCGDGYVSNHLLKAASVVGLDTSIDSLLIAKRRIECSNIELICADAAHLPFRQNSFNKVTALEVLEHLPEEAQKKVCHEANRILKERGIFLISIPHGEQINADTHARCGHLYSMDEKKVTDLLPSYYNLVTRCHLPNIGLVSLSTILQRLPVESWLLLNSIFGQFHKGYWVLLKFEKMRMD